MLKRLLIASLFVALSAAVLSIPADVSDASSTFPYQGDYVKKFRDVDDDEMVGLILKYVGDEESGLVDGNASGDVLLLVGDLASEAADTDASSNCGATAGTFDVSDADCDTFGELMYEINSSGADWIATLVDVPPWENSGASALILLDPGSGQQAKTDDGYAMLVDTSALDDTFIALLPQENNLYDADDMRNWTKGIGATTLSDQAAMWKDRQTFIEYITFIFGDADAGTSYMSFYVLDMNTVASNNYEGKTASYTYVRTEATDDTWTNRDFLGKEFSFPVNYRVWVALEQAGNTADADNHYLVNYVIGHPK